MKCHAEILSFRFDFCFWNLSKSVLILMPKMHQDARALWEKCSDTGRNRYYVKENYGVRSCNLEEKN
ncbi:MAG TPA: hypothetical protein V6D14_17705 [Coleofasciculaceae cyanobacterium]